MATSAPPPPRIPAFYRLVFLWVEPVSILLGAIYSHSLQSTYLNLTHAASAPGSSVPISTSIVMTQLANLYLGLSILEASVLRVTTDIKVWRTFIIGLLVADIGHLYSVAPAGSWMYWQYWRWNAIDWGNVGFVYFLVITRACMLLGFGFEKAVQRLKST
ncbi:hypothetical protein EK21DRAFT_104321 [Setomelanomma holmii]|uniref:DUF7704 domain-containing protein n=1 Tax=Setomelanomma holmii TaxID=210430 RepID=A0A9P4GXX9_9PLEO|nr:hypothetical protein EK21DRAFT_104321 [Setomelanomma holmii]